MVRISPETIVRAYHQTGLTPVQGVWLQDSGACGIGVLAVQQGTGSRGSLSPTVRQMQWPALNRALSFIRRQFGEAYICGFIRGFDGLELSDESAAVCGNRGRFNEGYEDGVAAWKSCLDAGFIVPHHEDDWASFIQRISMPEQRERELQPT